MTKDRTGDLFYDLFLRPELQRLADKAAREAWKQTHSDLVPYETQTMFRNAIRDTAPSQPHSATSRAAAELILPKAGTLRRKVYDFIAGCGPRGATDDEMQA